MSHFERHWPAILVLAVAFGMHLIRYLQWKWTRNILGQSSQIKWLFRIYGFGFCIACLLFWFGLNAPSGLSGGDYPHSVEDIQTPEKLLQLLQKYNNAARSTTDVLSWFIFFCMIWVTNLLGALDRAMEEQTTDNDVIPSGDLR